MKISLRADYPLDDATAKAATGRTLSEWYALLDASGGPEQGRRAIGSLLHDSHHVAPWWAATINVGYEAAHGRCEKDGRPKGYMICSTKAIKATAETCFAAFASAAALDRWLGSGHTLSFVEGGSLDNADGNRARIRKINPGKKIVMIWEQIDAAPDTPVEVAFQASGAKTTVMVSHDRLQTRAETDGLRAAWGEALTRLKASLECASS